MSTTFHRKILLNSEIDINHHDQNGITALIWASYLGNKIKIVVDLLINSNVDVNCQDNNGKNALIWASNFGNIEVVKSIIKTNVDLDCQDKLLLFLGTLI